MTLTSAMLDMDTRLPGPLQNLAVGFCALAAVEEYSIQLLSGFGVLAVETEDAPLAILSTLFRILAKACTLPTCTAEGTPHLVK